MQVLQSTVSVQLFFNSNIISHLAWKLFLINARRSAENFHLFFCSKQSCWVCDNLAFNPNTELDFKAKEKMKYNFGGAGNRRRVRLSQVTTRNQLGVCVTMKTRIKCHV